MRTYNCIKCGASLRGLHGARKYCDQCKIKKLKGKTGWSKNNIKERVCPICHNSFLPSVWNQKYCSKKCLYEFHFPSKLEIKKECRICGKKFIVKWSLQKFCSRKCSLKYNRKKLKIWQEQNRRKKILELGGKCVVCGLDDWRMLEVHHIVPQKLKGNDDKSNLVVLCSNHHGLITRNFETLENLLEGKYNEKTQEGS